MFNFPFRKKKSLKIVYDEDLIKYLTSIKIYDDIISGKKLCKFCGNKITMKSLEVIIPNNGKIEIVCQNKNCLNQL